MTAYLDFKNARCKDCYKCLRECPVKAIRFENHQAKIIEERCILCGKCTGVCPQNAKKVHSETETVRAILSGEAPVIACVAPSFVSSFGVQDFSLFRIALGKLGFRDAEETAVGAAAVTNRYSRLLASGGFDNFITSACPAVNRMIQLYYPQALKYLAPVVSPMVAHAKLLKKRFPNAKIVFIGPCIAKKREAQESGIIDGVLTFEELNELFIQSGIRLDEIASLPLKEEEVNKAKYYPISRGIIKSFDTCPSGYEYVAVDGVERCLEVLENIDKLSGTFLELNCCDFACVNGPCSLLTKGAINANSEIRRYVNSACGKSCSLDEGEDLSCAYPKLKKRALIPTEREISEVLAKTGKNTPEKMYNCGACGYSTCREKAIAVINGFADLDMCLPYMRERAESMSFEIIQNSPNGIVVLDSDFKIAEINGKAKQLLGIDSADAKGINAFDAFDSAEFMAALVENKNLSKKKLFINKTKKYIELNLVTLTEHKMFFAVMKDITDSVTYSEKLNKVKLDTLATTDEVIKKQMRVAQEIASLLGETTAETKVALLKLKQTLRDGNEGGE